MPDRTLAPPVPLPTTSRTPDTLPVSDASAIGGGPITLHPSATDMMRMHSLLGNQAMQRMMLTRTEGTPPSLGAVIPALAGTTSETEPSSAESTESEDHEGTTDDPNAVAERSADATAESEGTTDASADTTPVDPDVAARNGDLSQSDPSDPATDPDHVAVPSTSADVAPVDSTVVQPSPSPTTDMGNLQAQTLQAVDAVPRPTLGDFTPAQAAIRRSGFAMASARSGAAGTRSRGPAHRGGGGVSASREPSEPDPVPAATTALREKSNRRLDPVTPPPLMATLRGHMPVIGNQAISAQDMLILTTLEPGAIPSDLNEEQRAAFLVEQERLEGLRAALTGAPSPTAEPAGPEAATPDAAAPGTAPAAAEAPRVRLPGVEPIEDRGAPPPLNYSEPGEGVPDMSQVFARLLVDTDTTAVNIVRQVRDGVRIDGRNVGLAVSAAYTTLGEAEFKDQVKTTLDARVRALAVDAGITAEVLEERIAARRAEIEEQRRLALEALRGPVCEATEAIVSEGERSAGAVASAERRAEESTERTRDAAARVRLAMDVPSRRERLLAAVTTVVTEQVTQYRQQGDIRKSQLDMARRNQEQAYRFAAQQDNYEITSSRTSTGVTSLFDLADELNETDVWLATRIRELGVTITQLRTDTDTTVGTFQSEVRTAGDNKREAIRAWADERLGTARTEEDRVRQRATDEAEQREAETRAWAIVENQRTTAAIAHDFTLVEQFEADAREGLDRNAIIERRGLSMSQIAILDAYLTPSYPGESSESRALNAVAMGATVKLAQEQREAIEPQIAQLVMDRPDDEWQRLNTIAAAQGGDFNATDVAKQVREAIDQVGTDEPAIWRALASRTPLQVRVLRAAYVRTYGDTIDDDLASDLSGREYQRAQALMTAQQDLADAIGIRQATHGNWEGEWYDLGGITGIGTDTKAIQDITRGRDPTRREALEAAYLTLSSDGRSLTEVVHSEMTEERDRERFDASLSGDFRTADALELRDILPTPAQIRAARDSEGHNIPLVADRERMQAVYDRIRTEVTARGAREIWSTARIEAEIVRRNREIEGTFNSRFAEDYENPSGGALRGAFDIGFQWQPEVQNLANGLADNDHARIDAARIEVENRGVYADDDIQNQILNAQYTRALEGMRRDEIPVRRLIMARQLTDRERADPDRPWTSARLWEERGHLSREIDRTLETAAREEARGNMDALREAYHRDYHGSLDDVVLSNTSGYGNMRAETLLSQDGYLTPAQQIYFAIRGAGTRDEAVKGALAGRTEAEIAEIRAEFADLARSDSSVAGAFSRLYSDIEGTDFTNMDQEIMAEVSGRAEFDIGQMLLGTPETIDQRRIRLREALEYETRVGSLGEALGRTEMDTLRSSFDELDRSIDALNDPTIPPERRDVYLDAFEQNVQNVETGIAIHRASLDTMVDRVTTAIGVAIGLAVGAIITIFTFGAGGIVLAAVIGSILATAATMATKQLILGDQYGWEDIATDVAVGIVDALVAAATAGIGNKLLGIGKAGSAAATQLAARQAQLMARSGIRGAGARFFLQGAGRTINASESILARMIPTSARLSAMVERGGAAKLLATIVVEGGENFIQGSGSALMGTLLNDQTWERGNPLANIVSGTLQQAAMGAAMGLAIKPLHGAMSHAGDFVGSTWRQAGDPARIALADDWNAFRSQYPDVPYRDYVEARLQAGIGEGGPRVMGDDVDTAPARDTTDTTDTGDSSAGRSARSPSNEAEMRAILPETIRDQVSVEFDSTMRGRTVLVEYVRSWGGIGEIRIVAGPDARPIDILMHTPTASAMRRYTGLTGRVVQLIERLQFWVNRRGMPPFGSTAWEAHFELNKLPLMIEERIQALHGADIDAAMRAEILADIAHLSAQIDSHQATLDRMDIDPGSGFIAGLGRRAPEAGVRPVGERAAPDLPRYRADGSPLESRYGMDRVFQVGPSWREDGRLYRVVEVLHADGSVATVREEIRLIESNGREGPDWVQRGREGNTTGQSGEGASVLMTADDINVARANGLDMVALPQSRIQSGSGAGFDGVNIRFDANGVATISIVEVKNYPGRYVPLADFTAIRENLKNNLRNLSTLLADPTMAAVLGLTPAQRQAAFDAIKAKRFEVEIRRGPTTKLGTLEGGTVVADLTRELRKVLGSGTKVTSRQITDAQLGQAEAALLTADHIGSRPHFYELAGGTPGKFTEASVRNAQTAIAAERAALGIVDPPLSRTTHDTTFRDSQGNHFRTVDPETPRGNPGAREKVLRSAAQDLLTHLTATATSPPGATNSTRILVNVTDLTGPQRQDLLRFLTEAAKKNGIPQSTLRRLVLVDTTRGTVEPVTIPVKAKTI